MRLPTKNFIAFQLVFLKVRLHTCAGTLKNSGFSIQTFTNMLSLVKVCMEKSPDSLIFNRMVSILFANALLCLPANLISAFILLELFVCFFYFLKALPTLYLYCVAA